jgi:hypothetical protein
MLAHSTVREWFIHTIFYAKQPTKAQTLTGMGPGTTDTLAH